MKLFSTLSLLTQVSKGLFSWRWGTPDTAVGEVTGGVTCYVNMIKLIEKLYLQAGYPTLAGYYAYLGSPTSMLTGPKWALNE